MNIIELAKEAGFEVWEADYALQGQLERFAAIVRAEREWVDLTDDEIEEVWRETTGEMVVGYGRAVIAAWKAKNGIN